MSRYECNVVLDHGLFASLNSRGSLLKPKSWYSNSCRWKITWAFGRIQSFFSCILSPWSLFLFLLVVATMKYSSKAILLLAFVAVFGAAKAFSSDDTVKQADSTLLFPGHHGDLRAPQQVCQSEADTLLACLGSTSTGQACLDCVLAIDEELFITGSALCVDIESVMCDAWTNVCPCSPCEEEWEAYYLGCLYSDCLIQSCPTVDPCEDLFVEANSCVTSSAPFSCGRCVETAINDLNFTTMPCKELETKICDITSVDCSCSPCEQDLQDYYFCSASDRCEDLGPCTMPTTAANNATNNTANKL